jgi:hypothetical protein
MKKIGREFCANFSPFMWRVTKEKKGDKVYEIEKGNVNGIE